MSTGQQIIESFVYTNFNLNLNPDGVDIIAFSDALESLVSLGLATYISSGTEVNSSKSHVLHCRFKSYDDLKAFYNHPEYKSVLTKYIPWNRDGETNGAADWTSNAAISDSPKPGSAMRVILMNWKEGVDASGKSKFLQAITDLKNQSKGIQYISYGEDPAFTDPDGQHGFLICSIIYFPGLEELEAFDEDEELQKSLQEKMKDAVDTRWGDSMNVFDYVVRQPKK